MESISAAAMIGKKLEDATTLDASRVAQFIKERLPGMDEQQLTELHEAVLSAVGALEGGPDRQIILERAVRGAALLLSGAALASGTYALIPILFAAAFPDAVPGLKSPSAARADKSTIARGVLAAIVLERSRRQEHQFGH